MLITPASSHACTVTTKSIPKPPFVIALTGGIASGKTTVSNFFKKLGITLIDSDIIARRLTEPHQPALKPIQEAFGKTVFHKDGSLNRKVLGKIVFTNPFQRKILEKILHPLIQAETLADIKKHQYDSAYLIHAIPLLAETGSTNYPWRRILVVDCPKSDQIDRLMKRDQLSYQEATLRLAAQVSRQARLNLADDIIQNTASLPMLEQQVQKKHAQYLAMAAEIKL